MRQVFKYISRNGTVTYKVRYKIDGRSGSTTFPSLDDAQQFNLMVEKWGPRHALEFIKQPTEPKRTASGPTVTECVAHYISLRPNPTTRDTYTSWLHNSIEPGLGLIRINQLKHEQVQAWVNAQEGSAATIRRNLVVLSGALSAAQERGEIRINPASKIKLPRRPRNQKRAPLTPPYSREEYRLILKSMDPYYQVFVELLGETGCRFGEAAALTPADVSLRAGTIHFNKSYSRRGGVYDIGPTKTTESDRIIRVGESLLDKLDLSGEFIFTTRAGDRIKTCAFGAYHWKRALKKSGLPNHRHGHPHDLRHAHATWLLDAGVPLHSIQKRLGHADVMTTLRMYGHPATDSEDRVLAALESL